MPEKYVKNVREVFLDEDFEHSKERVIIPIAGDRVRDKVLLDRKTLETEHPAWGNKAIQFLFIPPFALIMSALSIFINFMNLVKTAAGIYVPRHAGTITIGVMILIDIAAYVMRPDLSVLNAGKFLPVLETLGGFEKILSYLG